MGDWEDFGPMDIDGYELWIDSINRSNERENAYDNSDKNNLDIEQKAPVREFLPKPLIFKNLQATNEFSMKYPGHTFVRNPDGPGFIIKGTIDFIRFSKKYKENLKRQTNIKQGKPPRSHFPWRDQEISSLLKLHNSGKDIYTIAIKLERKPQAISSRLRKLSLITEEEHQKYLEGKIYQISNLKLFEFLISIPNLSASLLARFYPLDYDLLGMHSKVLNFRELSQSIYLTWGSAVIEKFETNWDWDILSRNESLPWNESLIDKYKDKWSWKELSLNKSLPWGESLIGKYENNWDWKKLCINKALPWSESLIEKYENRCDWKKLCINKALPWSESLIEKYKDRWDWKILSVNESLPWCESLIDKYEYNWDWEELSMNKALPWNESLIDKYKDRWFWGDTRGDVFARHSVGLSSNESLPWSEGLIEKYKDRWWWMHLCNNESLPWSDALINNYKDKWTFCDGGYLGYGFEYNRSIPWSFEMLEFWEEDAIRWEEHFNAWGATFYIAPMNYESIPWSENLIEDGLTGWGWSWWKLSSYQSIPWSETLIEKYEDKWDWKILSENESLPWSEGLIEKYTDKWDWEKLYQNESIPWSLSLMKMFIFYNVYIGGDNIKAHEQIKKLSSSQIQEILDKAYTIDKVDIPY